LNDRSTVNINQVSASDAHIICALSAAPPPTAAEQAHLAAKRVRGLAGVARARIANSWLRLGASSIVAVVAASLVGTMWPFIWYGGLIVVVLIDRAVHVKLLRRCEQNDPPKTSTPMMVWTVAQSAYGNLLAPVLWFAPYVPGETLAVMYICGGLVNAAATMRTSMPLSLAALGPTVLTLLALPFAEYVLGGMSNPLELAPLVGAFLLLGFGVNLWRSLLASDAAQAEAEAAVMRERQAAAAAAAAKTDMIRRMNDELRTPMAALIGAAEHLRRAASTPQARAQIGNLAQAGEVLKLVLDDLSDLDRLENGRLPIEKKATDARALVKSVVSAFRVAAQDKNLELFLDVTPDVPSQVEIDPLRVRQVLFNLLANAVRYTNAGGVRVRLSAQPSDAASVRLNFVIADTGQGMSRAQLAMVLKRERVCADGEGPGLGLSISLKLARLMGGQLQAKSEVGQGSIFSFTLDAPIASIADLDAA
jgi:signal transduction histidine kinase